MYRRIMILFLLILLPPYLFSDSSVLQGYKQRFISADISAKSDIIREASLNSLLKETADFYEYALQFVLNNHAHMENTRAMNSIVNLCAYGLRETGGAKNIDALWRLFLEYPDSQANAEILITLGVIGKGNRNLINNLNTYLMERSLAYKLGKPVNYITLSACIGAVMELGDSSSYPALFTAVCAGYPEVIASEAYGALELIPGNLHQFLMNIIENNRGDEKFAAFRAGINSERLTLSQRGRLAELALEQAFAASLASEEANVDITAMRYAAVSALTSLRWTRANALAIRHYYRVQADYLQNEVPKERFIEAINCLGAVGNSDAALALGLQLGLINARMEKTNIYDAEITLAIVKALGQIGYNGAFDHLLYVDSLSYNEDIQAAAREAVDRLKW